MATRIETQNVKDLFNDPERTDALFAALDMRPDDQQSDVIFYSEAYALGKPMDRAGVRRRFYDRGYLTTFFDYEPEPGRLDAHAGALVYRESTSRRKEPQELKLAGRTALWAALKDPKTGASFSLAGAHFFDGSPRRRRRMVQALGDVMRSSEWLERGESFVLGGTLNATNAQDVHTTKLRLARPLRPLARLVAATPGRSPEDGWRRKASLLERGISMATDGVISDLLDLGLRSTDPDVVPTIPADDPILRTTYIMTKGMKVEDHGVEVRNMALEASNKQNLLPGSLAVWAVVEPRPPIEELLQLLQPIDR